MGFRVRRSIKIAPGVRLNIGKKSVGMSAGVKGARISTNTRTGTRATISAPGTGLSYSQKIGGTASGRRTPRSPSSAIPAHLLAQPVAPSLHSTNHSAYNVRVVGVNTVTCPCLCSCCSKPTPHPFEAQQYGSHFGVKVPLAAWKPIYCAQCAQHIQLVSRVQQPVPPNINAVMGCGCLPALWIGFFVALAAFTHESGISFGGSGLLAAICCGAGLQQHNIKREQVITENTSARLAAGATQGPQCVSVGASAVMHPLEDGGTLFTFSNPQIAQVFAQLNGTHVL